MKTNKIKLGVLACLIGLFSFTSCTKDDDLTQIQAEDNIQSGIWEITRFVDSGNDESKQFIGYNFIFEENGSLMASNGTVSYYGKWSIEDSNDDIENDLDFNINFNPDNNFRELNDDWDIISRSTTRIELKDTNGGNSGKEDDGNSGTDYLTFKKK